jgi:hypothetical protein
MPWSSGRLNALHPPGFAWSDSAAGEKKSWVTLFPGSDQLSRALRWNPNSDAKLVTPGVESNQILDATQTPQTRLPPLDHESLRGVELCGKIKHVHY